METLIDRAPPEIEHPSSTSAGRPHRRWFRFAILTLVPILLLGGIGFSIYLSRYQPLTGNGTGAYWVDPALTIDLGSFQSPSGDIFNAYRVDGGNGSELRFGFTLNNIGSLPVRIDSVGDPRTGDWMRVVEVRTAPETAPVVGIEMPADPFRPFTLGSDEGRIVIVTVQLPDCGPPQPGDKGWGSSSIGTERVDFTVLGMHREATIVLPYSIEIRTGMNCPA
jgi:hypothetical protein